MYQILSLLIVISFCLGCSNSNPKAGESNTSSENQSEEKLINISDPLHNGVYEGSLKSNKGAVISMDFDGFYDLDELLNFSRASLWVEDFIVQFLPWIEHSGNYGEFKYSSFQNKKGLNLTYQASQNVRMDTNGFTFHYEWFTQNILFSVNKSGNNYLLKNSDYELILTKLK